MRQIIPGIYFHKHTAGRPGMRHTFPHCIATAENIFIQRYRQTAFYDLRKMPIQCFCGTFRYH
jgi:hypothetical protein